MVIDTSKYGDRAMLGGECSLHIDEKEYAFGEAVISIDRAAVSASRAGKWSDYKRPGKVNITGSISRLHIDGTLMDKLLGGHTIGPGKTFNMVVSGSHGSEYFEATVDNAFLTSGEITCGSSDSFVEEPHNWEMQDADTDFNLDWPEE